MPSTSFAGRRATLALAALVAVAATTLVLAVSGARDSQAETGRHHGMAGATAKLNHKQLAFHDGMRKLWEDHVTWTRLAIVSLEGGTPDADATVARLLRNQVDLGNAIKPYYGAKAGTGLTRLLKSHILIAADVIAAAKASDKAKLADAQARWVQNADQIAAFLHAANPRHWPLGALKHEMHMHLDLTTAEAVAHLQQNWPADVAAYDRVHDHILHMSDVLADGIVAQFPGRFR
jgi:hypothetical protein